jgi:TonB family protein
MKPFALAFTGFEAQGAIWVYYLRVGIQSHGIQGASYVVGWCVLLERLESGFLLFETPEGRVPVDLSLWQRAYLLWTFRNFRRLSLPLLNSRQAAMVRTIAQKNAGSISRSYDPSLVIGIVESFKLPTGAVSKEIEAKPELSPVTKTATTNDATLELAQGHEQPAWNVELFDKRQSEIGAMPKTAWLESVRSRIDLFKPLRAGLKSLTPVWSILDSLKQGLPKLGLSGRRWIRSEWPKATLKNFSASGLVTASGVLFLCIGSVIAWHRMGAVAGSEAHSRPNQIESSAQIESPPVNATELRKTSVVEHSSRGVSSRPKEIEEQTSGSRSPLGSPGLAAVDIVKPTATINAIASIKEHGSGIQNVGSVSEPPLPEGDVQATRPPLRPLYPDYSGIGARGVVVLVADVDAEGVVRSVRVVRGNRALAAAAVRAVRKWHYAPYFEDSKAVATETNIVISVFSDDAISMSFPPSIASH